MVIGIPRISGLTIKFYIYASNGRLKSSMYNECQISKIIEHRIKNI